MPLDETRYRKIEKIGEDEYEEIDTDDRVESREVVPGPGLMLSVERHTIVEKHVVYKNGKPVKTWTKQYTYYRVKPDIRDTVKLYGAITSFIVLASVLPSIREISRRDLESMAYTYLPNEYGEGVPVFKAVSPDGKEELKGIDILKAPPDFVLTINEEAKPLIERLKNESVIENEY